MIKGLRKFASVMMLLFFVGGIANALDNTNCIALEVTIQYLWEGGAWDLADELYEVYVSGGCLELY